MSAERRDRVRMSQSFEFAAAHRLHIESLDDERNRAIFGKCNNPSGHGHNYRVEVSVAVPLEPDAAKAAGAGDAFTIAALERIVMREVIDRFDHKHLNVDTVEFAKVNPSVENIARVCHELLVEPIRRSGAELQQVTIWETEKTACTYPAG